MERLKNMGLKKSFLLLSLSCLAVAFLLLGAVIFLCRGIENYYPLGGVEILSDGSIVPLPSPTASQQRILAILNIVQTLSCILFPVGGLIVSVFLFYYLKLKQPISCLQNGIMRIQNNDLDFSLPILSNDEMGQLCAAFEEMRSELLKSNRLLWQQAEERKRLNAAFSHDLRNPITVLKGGVICIDIERLSRGSSLESGYIMQVLQTNNCKIITPSKIYDLQNESDEQFTDMKFMFSRYELKTITKRLVRGRNQSASEGKFLGSVAPYGYRAYKLVGMKGNSLRIEPKEAKVVRMIFDMYGKQGIGYNTIAHELNQMNIPSLTGTWGQTSITNILNNEVYLGMIRWKHEPTKRVVKDGMLTKKRVTSKDYELYEGLHEPIIDQEQWDRVKAVQSSRNHASVHKDKKLMNPFATILFCEKCGAVMKRNVPAKTQNTSPWYRCPTRGCNCRTIKCDFLEAEVVKAMSQWWGEYTIKIKEDKVAQTDSTETALSIVREQLTELQLQQDKICEYLEKGIYTIEMLYNPP